jgi:hypothetical protein
VVDEMIFVRPGLLKIFATAWVVCALAVGGCASYTSATTTVEELNSSSKGAVIMMASFDGVPFDKCGIISVETGGNAGAGAARKVRSRDHPNPGFWLLEPGPYEVKAIHCLDGLTMLGTAGYGNFVVFARFSVVAGEVLNLGQLVVGGEFKNRQLKVDDLPADTIQSINRDFPNLAGRLTKKYMTIDAAVTNAQEVAWEKAAKNSMTFGAILRNATSSPVYVPQR